mmetsp:Transcript_17049/g.23860  ORF Transcript_17049/g.23860 Transcript_17049/m.23860 type:complete len:205 (-) Transcript_17049:330-944(-)
MADHAATSSSSESGSGTGRKRREKVEARRATKPERREQKSSVGFECNICLTAAQRPVVTLCGHLYCWPCLYKWLRHSKKEECPVCKARVLAMDVIPIYGRGGAQKDPRKETRVPDRPQARARRGHTSPGSGTSSGLGSPGSRDFRSIHSTFGMFPTLFGGTTTHIQPAGEPIAEESAREAAQQEQLSRLLLFLGSLVIMCLLMF